MKTRSMISLVVLMICASGSLTDSHAKPGPQDEAALARVLSLLTNPAMRDQTIKQDSGAQQADAQVTKLTGGDAATTQAIYALSAEIFKFLFEQSKGDPTKLLEVVAKAQQDPKAFAASLPPGVLSKIKNLALELEKKQTKSTPAP